MDLLGYVLDPRMHAEGWNPTDDRWYQSNPGMVSLSGLRVDEDGAKKLSAWFRGRFILASAIAMLPLKVYRRLPDGGRAEASDHPLYDVIHRKPNAEQDSFQWRLQWGFWMIDSGWAYYRYTDGPRGFADQLVPIAPSRVTPKRTTSGRLVFEVRRDDGSFEGTLTTDELLVFRGPDGKGILEYARDSLGLGLALEGYSGRLFRQGGLHGHVVKVPGPMVKEQADALAAHWSTGLTHAHTVKVLANGAELQQTTMDPEKLQMILSRKFTVNDIARWLGLPPHMLGDLDRASFSNIEHQGQEFIDYSLGPWLTLFEAALNDQAILRPETYYVEFNRDALVRGDIATRWAAHVESVNAGIKTVDEVRVIENLPKRGGKADELREPANITGKPAASTFPRQKSDAEPRAQAIAHAAAGRLLRKEMAFVQKAAVRHASDADAFAVAVTEFYAGHVALVSDALGWTEAQAQDYCAGQCAQVVAGDWVTAVGVWSTSAYAGGVAALALEGASV